MTMTLQSATVTLVALLVLPALGRGSLPDGAVKPDPAKIAAMRACAAKYPDAQGELAAFTTSGSTKSDHLKCLMSCNLQARGIMTADGTISVPSNPMKPIPDEWLPCFSLAPASAICDTAYEHLRCVWEKSPSRDFLRALSVGGKAMSESSTTEAAR